jgi:hypothetical protein
MFFFLLLQFVYFKYLTTNLELNNIIIFFNTISNNSFLFDLNSNNNYIFTIPLV